MITLLNLETVPDNNSLKDRILSFIPRRAIRVQDILYHNLTIRDIDVLPRGEKVPWNKISRIIGIKSCVRGILFSRTHLTFRVMNL